MKRPTPFVVGILSRLRRRFTRSRPGSVLILCVALLVLLALIGTAMISTARIDRYAAVQHSYNTEVDLLVEGVKQLAEGAIVGDLFDTTTGQYRPPTYPAPLPAGYSNTYDHWDAPRVTLGYPISPEPPQDDRWLAPRYPTLPDPLSAESAANPVVWRCISAPLAMSPGSATLEFESPLSVGSLAAHYTQRTMMIPTFAQVPDATGTLVTYPAMQLTIGGPLVIAADADGDGIADAGLFRLPVGTVNGVTYYGAVRIVDNNSAINVNSAWSRRFDFTSNYNTTKTSLAAADVENQKGFYRTNVGLLELLRTYKPLTLLSPEMDALNNFRFGNSGTFASTVPGGTFTFTYANQCDALENGLTGRMDNPDVNTGALNYQAFSLADQAALASHFCVRDASASTSNLENVLSTSVKLGAAAAKYPPNATDAWFKTNFFWPGVNPTSLRAALVARNPVSNAIPAVTLPARNGTVPLSNSYSVPTDVPARFVWGMAAYHKQASGSTNVVTSPKTDINTAAFDELWRAFWSVMADNIETTGSLTKRAPTHPPFPSPAGTGDPRMFRSTVRDFNANAAKLTPTMVMQLRSALAAVNAIDLRDSDNDITSAEIPLYDIPDGSSTVPAAPKYTARVYGTEQQPFITEIYANTYTGDPGLINATDPNAGKLNVNGYVAIELYNPYNHDLILTNWTLGKVDRSVPSGPGAQFTVVGLTPGAMPPSSTPPTFAVPAWGTSSAFLGGGQIVISAGKYVVLENYPPNGTPPAGATPNEYAVYRPVDATISAGGAQYVVYVPNLHEVLNREAVLMRPHFGNGTLNKSLVSGNLYDEGAIAAPNLTDFVPIDSFDFTHLMPGTATTAEVWHYTRASAPGNEWKFVYPGLYLPNSPGPRHSGIIPVAWNPPGLPTGTLPVANLTAADATSSDTVNPWPGVQLANDDWGGYNKITGVTATFPFGAFARDGDILQVPFIGAYQIRDVADPTTSKITDPHFWEMNAVTMDCGFVDDQARDVNNGRVATDTYGSIDDAVEHLGRFCPVQIPTDPSKDPTLDTTSAVDDYWVSNLGVYGTYDETSPSVKRWMYHFATRLFDYLTVHSPATDYKPNVDPTKYGGQKVAVQNGADKASDPFNPVAAAQNVGGEDTVGVDGLININTAPWWVLATLPLLPDDIAGPDSDGDGFPDALELLAKQIVAWRDGVSDQANKAQGPFRTIFDLNRVVYPFSPVTPPATYVFRDAIKNARAAGTDLNDIDGDVSPNGATGDGVHNDFEEQFAMLTRISNLITTRSDSFTVYIVVQGWRNAGTATPELVVQRRAAMIIDRSNVTGVSGAADPKKTAVATD